MPLSLLVVVGLMLVAVVLAACAARSPAARSPAVARASAAPSPAAVTVSKDSFHGWEALVLRNPVAEVTVVPAIGRIMQIALLGGVGADGVRARSPFWSHPGIGPDLGGDENGWINLGGDKAWPAPQARWEAIVGKGWPPPRTFDASPFDGTIVSDAGDASLKVELLSAVDPAYGLRVRRTIALDPAKPVVTVETCYDKVEGREIRAGVWTITQLVSPERLFMRLPPRSSFPGGFAQRLPSRPKELAVEGRLLSLARDPAAKTMLASDGDALLWVGNDVDLLIETVATAHDPAGEWPDGAHAQIYTSSDEALPYVELELFSPLRDLRIGERASLRVRYTLEVRTNADPTAEAKRVLGL
jgi:hypothetical protein